MKKLRRQSHTFLCWRGMLLLGLALMLAACGGKLAPSPAATAAPGAATALPAATSIPVVSDPQALAENVYKAADADARYQALLLVMRALNIGVYEPQAGKAILRGAERGPNDFYLYDFELRALASALERGQTWDTAYLANFFNAAGFVAGDNPVDADTLRQALRAAVQSSAAAPDDPSSLVFLLVRELGLRHATPYDMLQEVPQEQLQFDALQTLLIEADVLVPVIREGVSMDRNGGARLAANSSRHGLAAPALQPGPCENMTGLSGTSPFLKYGLGLIPGAAIPVLVLDMIHGEMLAYSVDVRAVSETQSTHYGHQSPGAEMRFQIQVKMLDDYGDFLVNCGALAGYQIPKPGGIPGIGILWTTEGLEKHGDISYEPPDEKTDANGIATLVFKPKREKRPGQGPVIEEKGTVGGLALYQSAFGNIPGSVAQFLAPKGAVIAWTVARHKNLSLEIKLSGTIEGSVGKWDLGNQQVLVPLEDDGAGGWKGHAETTLSAVLSGECNGTATWPASFDVAATGSDPLNFSISGSFLPQFNIQCDSSGGAVQLPAMKGTKPFTFNLASQDGASFEADRFWTFTLREQ